MKNRIYTLEVSYHSTYPRRKTITSSSLQGAGLKLLAFLENSKPEDMKEAVLKIGPEIDEEDT